MPGEKISPELCHIEYDDGDEQDMDREEVSAAVALAASRRSDD